MVKHICKLLLPVSSALLVSFLMVVGERPALGQVLVPQQKIVTPTASQAVAVSADTLVVGTGSEVRAPVYVFVSGQGGWTRQAVLLSSDWTESDAFGSSVALSGDTIVVGAASKGAAYVFVHQGTAWTQQAKLLGDGVATNGFGSTVALSGDTALVGCASDASRQGSAYAFVRSGTSWIQQQKLVAGDGSANDHFGQAVSIYQETAAVGYMSAAAGNRGAVDVFVRSGATWTEQQRISTSSHLGVRLGRSVSIWGDTIATSDYTDLNERGDVFVFNRSGASWAFAATLGAGDPATNRDFGYSVALSGDALLVGAPSLYGHQGRAYVFTRSGTAWAQTQEIFASDGVSQGFGTTVALFGNTAAVAGPPGGVYVSAPLQTTMTGARETPPNSSMATGSCLVNLNATTGQVSFSGTFSGLVSSASSATLRGLAGPGAIGPAMLASTALTSAKSGMFSGAGTLSPGQISGILAGNAYCEVTDALFSAGEIRGQIPAAPTDVLAVPALPPGAVTILTLLLSTMAVLAICARASRCSNEESRGACS